MMPDFTSGFITQQHKIGFIQANVLLTGKVHFSIGYVGVGSIFVGLILPSEVYTNYKEYALSRIPQPTKNLMNLMQVFDLKTWIALAVGLFLFSVLCYIFVMVYDSLGAIPTSRANFMDILLIIFCGFTEPDPVSWFNKQCKGGSLLFLTWSLFAFFMTASYSSMLLSFLTLPSLEKVVENARDILELQKTIMIDPTDEDGFSLESLKAIFPEDVAIWANDHKLVLSKSITPEEMTYNVVELGKIFVAPKRYVLEGSFFSGYLDQIRFSTDTISNANNNDCLLVGKGFPWTDLILNDMLRMSAGGIFDHNYYNGISQERLQILEPRNIPSSIYVNDTITLEHLTFIFLFWITGMVVGACTFAIERM